MELVELMALLRSTASGERAIQTAAAYRPFPLKLSFSSYNDGIAWICDQYKSLGLKAEKIDFPADGKTTFADRHFPLAWDIEDGWLKIAGHGFQPEVLASYQDDPYGMVPFSADSKSEQTGVIIPATALKEDLHAGASKNIVVLFDKYPGYDDIQWAINHGGKAIVACAGIDPSGHAAYNARRWFNDMFGEGQIDARSATLPAYSLPPAIIVELIKYHKQHGPIPVKYLMRARTYAGTVAAALAKLDGTDPHEKSFMLSAHAYEPNASNNVAGVAICIEAARILTGLIKTGALPGPRRGIRFFHGLETFGLYAYAMQNPDEIKKILCGLTIDCFGYRDRNGSPETLELGRCSYIHPSCWHALIEKTAFESGRQMKMKCKVDENSFSINDDIIADPLFGPAWNILRGTGWAQAGFYHNNTDTIEHLSTERMAEAAVFAAASAYMAASAGKDEALSFAKMTCQSALKQYAAENAALMGGISKSDDDIREKGIALQLYNKTVVPAVMASIASAGELFPGGEQNTVRQQINPLADQFKKAANGITAGMLNSLATILGGPAKKLFKSGTTPAEKDASLLLPARRLPGVIGLGTLSKEARTDAARFTGRYADEFWNFMATHYYWFDGQRTVLEAAMAHYAQTVVKRGMASQKTRLAMVERLKDLTAFLEKHDYLKITHIPPPPIVTREALVAGLKQIGIKPGDLLMVHSSLSQFGEVKGGPDTVIDALMEAVGFEGILVLPAFTTTVDGDKEPPFDPQSSKADTGNISETFWRRKGVLRNAQPTHSVAAWGRKAEEFLRSENLHDTFDWRGPWGRLYRWNGKILSFGETMGATTYLHALEAWFLAYLDKAYARVKDGDGEKLFYILNYPNGCRGGWYALRRAAAYFKRLYTQGCYRETKIGAAAALVINVRDLTREIHALFKEDPAVLLHKNGCLPCAERRARLVGWNVPDTLPDNTKIE